MPIRSVTMRTVYGHPKFSPEARIDLTAVQGIDLLEEFARWAERLPVDYFDDTTKRRYGRKPTVHKYSRLVVLEMRTGHYGVPGEEVIDTEEHTSRYTTRDIDASTVLTRCALFIPPNSEAGLYFTERQGHENAGTRVYNAFEAHIDRKQLIVGKTKGKKDAVLTLKAPAVLWGDAWIEAADIEEMNLIQYTEVSDLGESDPLLATPVVYTSSITPRKGRKFLPRYMKDSAAQGKEQAVKFFTNEDVREEDDYDVEVKLAHDGQTRKYLVGKTRTPVMRYVLSEEGESPLTLEQFVHEVEELSKRHFEEQLQLGWGENWIS